MKKKVLALVLAVAMVGTFALAGCGSSSSSEDTTADDAASAAEETEEAAAEEEETEDAEESTAVELSDEVAGFTEYPIFEDVEVGFINLSCVYFQPVPMSNGNESIEGFDIHLEADISALANDLGYGVGDWVPYLTVDYEVIGSDGETAASGTFMVMSASDGPHYGANIALPEADTYTLVITIHNPEENGYLLHTDAETGPGGSYDTYFSEGNLVYTYSGWDYVPQEW